MDSWEVNSGLYYSPVRNEIAVLRRKMIFSRGMQRAQQVGVAMVIEGISFIHYDDLRHAKSMDAWECIDQLPRGVVEE